jgi:DNA-binding CsgD family transcriptional regulator
MKCCVTGETFVDAATRLCEAAAELGASAAVLLHRASGPAGLLVDNFRDVTDDGRRWLLTEECWRVNPQMIELRRQLAVLGPEVFDAPAHTSLSREKGYVGVDDKKHVGVPLLGPGGWFGSIGYALSAAPTAEVERKLGIIATDLSVWCTQHGVSRLPEVRPLARRQLDAARLAAAGRTNLEIADELGVSVNTVKVRLKQAFEHLGVANRTELANVLRRLAPLEGVSAEITHRGAITITRVS